MALRLNSRGIPTWRGAELDLPPKERAVLTMLIKSSPEALSKDDIIKHAWIGDKVVSDDSLVRCISQIRKALPEVRVEPVYGFGYRLLFPRLHSAERDLSPKNTAAVMEQYLHAAMLAQNHVAKPLKQAINVYRSIILNSPNFAPAKIGLAKAITLAMGIGLEKNVGVFLPEAIEHLEVAEVIAPESVDLLSTKAWLLDIQWKFSEARNMHQEALRRAPENVDALLFYSLHLMRTGKAEEAVAPLRRVLSQRPYSSQIRAILARTLGMANQYTEAMEEISIAEEHEHTESSPVIKGVKIMVSATFEPTPRLAQIAQKLSEVPNIPPYARVNLAYVLMRCGFADKARQLVQERLQNSLPDSPEGILMAKDLVAIGELDQAADRLLDAFQARNSYLPMLLHSPELVPVLGHPRVEGIYRQMYCDLH